MRFNRAITPVKVLSFDLDDTLYNNHPIIKAALQAQFDYLATIEQWHAKGPNYWRECRNHIGETQPELQSDVTKWRQVALRYGFAQLGFSERQAQEYANAAYKAFADARSNIVVSDDVLELLAQLREKYTLIAITNGNVEVEKFNLKGEFDLVLQAGPHGEAKPSRALFDKACALLEVNPNDILHIGDSLDTDVQGANNAGCYRVWLDNQGCIYNYKGLADIEITDIMQLALLTK